MDAGKRTLSDIIKSNRLLDVPFYQRSYVWGKDQWERLLEDVELISETDHRYFIGSIILKQQQTNSSSRYEKRTIIDGQQRLTTLSIFFKVLSLKMNDAPRFDDCFRLSRDENGNRNLAIRHSYRDIDAFNRALDAESTTELSGEDRITQCFNYFVKHVNPDKLSFDKIYNSLLFVGIDLGIEEDEQQIFDTINSLGVRLTTSELLKNYFFKENNIDQYEEYWRKTFETDKATIAYWEQEITAGRFKRTLIDVFFYSFLQIKIQDKSLGVDTKDKLLYGKVERLFESYKHFLGKYQSDTIPFLTEIREYANLFREIIHPSSVIHPIEHGNAISRINNVIFGLDASILISYVLFIVKENGGDEESLAGILNAVEAYIVRRVIVKASTKEYGSLFNESLILNNIYTREGFFDYVHEKGDKNLYVPNDHQLQQGFDNSKLTNDRARGILYLLESSVRDYNRQSNSLLSMKKYSLEHLMPKKWENNWGKLEDQDAIDFRDNKLLTLGNLAIITQSLNANINDADWQTKLKGRGSHKGLKAYSGGIETLTEYLDKKIWDENSIQERASKLYEKAVIIWPVG